MKTIKYLALFSAISLSSLAAIFCAMVGAYALSVSESPLALLGWLGMLWFAGIAFHFFSRAVKGNV